MTIRRPNAFSLMELIVVVALLGIVAAVTMSRMNSVDRKGAVDDVDLENVSRLQEAVERYRFEGDGSPPESLASLIPQFLHEMPVSPEGKSYVYHATTGIVAAPE